MATCGRLDLPCFLRNRDGSNTICSEATRADCGCNLTTAPCLYSGERIPVRVDGVSFYTLDCPECGQHVVAELCESRGQQGVAQVVDHAKEIR
jgi:hypothetical protein